MKKQDLKQIIKEEIQNILVSEDNSNVTFHSFLEGLYDRARPDVSTPGRKSLFINEKQWNMLKWLYVKDISKPNKMWDQTNNRWSTLEDNKVQSVAIKNDTVMTEIIPPTRGNGRLFIFQNF